MQKLSKREFTKLRKEKDKSTLKDVFALLKPFGWKKYQYMLWKKQGPLFLTLGISTHLNATKTSLELSVKPLAIDPILWDIMDIPENHTMPLSFRSVGAFTCSTLPLSEYIVENDDSVESLPEFISQWTEENTRSLFDDDLENSFSGLYKAHVNQLERGAYAISIICCLIAENREREALELARKYDSGELESVFQMTNTDGKSFHYHAIKAIENNSITSHR